jgi:hypothetical protein
VFEKLIVTHRVKQLALGKPSNYQLFRKDTAGLRLSISKLRGMYVRVKIAVLRQPHLCQSRVSVLAIFQSYRFLTAVSGFLYLRFANKEKIDGFHTIFA